ncbi:DUF2309 domain-containing protein [Arcicella aquatica]|uniref:Probable inorganic carbon transporter subunit DabA n=1 Tax=Arcicella aquatica TaxID=217141 RepID=A0ABU5QR55_9BACT|nr:DUF2309 domain-containing protein [Arcicella aquatica]MEA5259503.1 DUF2309 domain-containing protein [Arcicella aquatica]
MKAHDSSFDEHEVLHELKHYLPAQAPLKDFVHHNTLHAFQQLKFYKALRKASKMFGYNVFLGLDEFRALYQSNRISLPILEKVIIERMGEEFLLDWKEKVLQKTYETAVTPRIGTLRANWKLVHHIDMDLLVHPILFRILCSFLDQGISIWSFPNIHKGFLASIREMERNSFTSFFKTERAKNILLNGNCKIEDLLKIIVGDSSLYKQYLFDQQFAHQGWSGMVSVVEDIPETLLDHKKISTHDLIVFELLLEIDALDFKFGQNWAPLGSTTKEKINDILAEVPESELNQVLSIWQDAFEWTYYDQVLAGIQLQKGEKRIIEEKSFQAIFCIDDRECSIRRYLEKLDTNCETFGTPGFFGVEFYYQPEHANSYTKQCPAPVTPKFLIKEVGSKSKQVKDAHFTKHTHSLFSGWFISQTLGFWSAMRLFLNIFRPTTSAAAVSSFKHMDKESSLTIEHKHDHAHPRKDELQVGFTVAEMAQRMEGLLKSIGLVNDFAPVVYIVGHGASSVNNTHYAGYDCGACCGRPGSVNARVASSMLNHKEVRAILATKGIDIPDTTQFVGALHDTTRDEISFFDEKELSEKNKEGHSKNEKFFIEALDFNAKERSRRFESINTKLTAGEIHDKIRTRSVSLFEPRPELNHATNAVCIVGRRELSKELFLDRRAFMNSYNYQVDLEGKFLFNILKAAAPVCGGINLEYYFSRVDNQKLGAGSKLPHNVMGLFGVANGIDGDLRPGLPSQMIEVHDPIRMLFIVEHFPEVVLNTIKILPETYEWFNNEWVHLIVVNPENREMFRFQNGHFVPYQAVNEKINSVSDIESLLESHQENFPVYLIK